MSKEKKQPQGDIGRDPRQEKEWPPLTKQEQEISLVCLRYFRGDWDLYLDYLAGSRVSQIHSLSEMPLVEQLKDRDRGTDFLASILEDEIITTVESLPFPDLYRLWEHSLLLHPEADPFKDQTEQHRDEPDRDPEPHGTVH